MYNVVMVLLVVLSSVLLLSCDENWICQTKGKTMFSMSSSGKIGSAEKGCSCEEIKSFELSVHGRVDEAALKRDFGC